MVAVKCSGWPEQTGLSLDAVGGGGIVVRSAVPVMDCPSGLVTVMSFVLQVAPTVEMLNNV